MTDYDTMQAGREMDEAVALAMGWRREKAPEYIIRDNEGMSWRRPNGGAWTFHHRFSHSPFDVWVVVEWLRVTAHSVTIRADEYGYSVTVEYNSARETTESGPNKFMLAICRAALKFAQLKNSL